MNNIPDIIAKLAAADGPEEFTLESRLTSVELSELLNSLDDGEFISFTQDEMPEDFPAPEQFEDVSFLRVGPVFVAKPHVDAFDLIDDHRAIEADRAKFAHVRNSDIESILEQMYNNGLDMLEAAESALRDTAASFVEPGAQGFEVFDVDEFGNKIDEPVEAPGNPKDAIGSKKPDLSLIPPAGMLFEAQAMMDGARKYGPYNWRSNPVKARVYIAAAMRHLQQLLDGEDFDPVSGVHHIGHARACLGIYADAVTTNNLIDDRPPVGAAGSLIRQFEATGSFDEE